MSFNKKKIFSYISFSVTLIISCFWAFWGSIENFHEGWWEVNLSKNLMMAFGQYLAPMFFFILLGCISVKWNRIGALLHLALGYYLSFIFFGGNSPAAKWKFSGIYW